MKNAVLRILLIISISMIFSCATTEKTIPGAGQPQGNGNPAAGEELSNEASSSAALTVAVMEKGPVKSKSLISLLPFTGGDDSLTELLSSTAIRSMELNIRLAGNLDVSINNDDIPEPTLEALRKYSLENEIESTVFGEISADTNGMYKITYHIYDTGADSIKFTDTCMLESLLDIFDAADEISLNILSGLSGTPLEFGTLSFRGGIDELENPDIYINDVKITPAGGDIKLIAGVYDLSVLSSNRLLLKRQIPVGGNARTIIEIPSTLKIYNIQPGWEIVKDSGNNLWTNNSKGAAKYIPSEDRWVQYTKSPSFDIKSNDMGRIEPDGDNLWISYGRAANMKNNLGVTKWNTRENTFTHFGWDENTPGFPKGPARIARRKADGTIWVGIGSENAVVWYDGNRWNPFLIENGTLYSGCSDIRFEGSLGYFTTWNGGLHVYDFASERWLHTPEGADNGRGSFLARWAFPSNTDVLPGGKSYHAVNISDFENPPLKGNDGVWYYDGDKWSRITDSLPHGGKGTGPLLADDRGRVWCYFFYDNSIKIWDGGTWENWEPLDFKTTADNNLRPMFFDGDYLWLAYIRGKDAVTARVKYR